MMWLYIFPDITFMRHAPVSSHGEMRSKQQISTSV